MKSLCIAIAAIIFANEAPILFSQEAPVPPVALAGKGGENEEVNNSLIIYHELLDLCNAYDSSPSEENLLKIRAKMDTYIDALIKVQEKRIEIGTANVKKKNEEIERQATALEKLKTNRVAEAEKRLKNMLGKKYVEPKNK